jgi:hypothetical protein
LTIVPRLSALDIARGSSEDRVASLAFLAPRSVSVAFRGSDAAQAHAARAYRLRRVAAGLTDMGILIGAAAATPMVPSPRRGVALSCAFAIVAASVPIHFAADAALSRAVWAYNRQFSR